MTKWTAGRAALAAVLALAALAAWRQRQAADVEQTRARVEALQRERDRLRSRLDGLLGRDPRLAGMPATPLRVGLPTPLARTLAQRLLSSFVDSITLRLSGLKVHKTGTVRKIVALGDYRLDVAIGRVDATLETGPAQVGFGDNRVTVALPVRLARGTGDATVDFDWRGRSVGGAVCGDMRVRQEVAGRVRPAEYPVSGSLLLTATDQSVLAEPKFPPLKVKLQVEPSRESWAAVQRRLDEKRGMCGFVLDRINVAGALEGLVGKGFEVRLPTEKIRPVAVPVGLATSMTVRGETVTLAVKVSHVAITQHMIWLGAEARPGP